MPCLFVHPASAPVYHRFDAPSTVKAVLAPDRPSWVGPAYSTSIGLKSGNNGPRKSNLRDRAESQPYAVSSQQDYY